MKSVGKVLHHINDRINKYFGFCDNYYIPIYAEKINDNVYIYSRLKNKRFLIKETFDSINLEENYNIEDQRKILEIVSGYFFSGFICRKYSDVVKSESAHD